MNINGSTGIVGIFGWPIEHTLSPAMHNAAFAALNLDYIYVPFAVEPKTLHAAAQAIRVLGLRGVNVTVPHKQAIIPFLDRIDPLARRIGSVNTVVNRNGTLCGYNTDAAGFIQDVRAQGFVPRGATALLIGAGGVATAIAHALAAAGAKKIFVSDVLAARARQFARQIPRCTFVCGPAVRGGADNADIIINATPLGMHAEDPSPVNARYLRRGVFVYDVVYNRKTRLMKDARTAGAKAAGGLGMLLLQGAIAFELWTGKKAPVEVMRKALRRSIKAI